MLSRLVSRLSFLLQSPRNRRVSEGFIGEEKTNKHKQLFGIVPGMGGGQNCLCVPFLLGKKGNIYTKFKENLKKKPGQSRDNPVKHLFMCFLFIGFSVPKFTKGF